MPSFLLHATLHDSDKVVRKPRQNCVRASRLPRGTKDVGDERFPIAPMMIPIRSRCVRFGNSCFATLNQKHLAVFNAPFVDQTKPQQSRLTLRPRAWHA